MSRGPDAKGTNINMPSGAFASTLEGHLYNIKHIARTCIVFGGSILPNYPKFFWFTYAFGSITILLALGTARSRNRLLDEDPAPEQETGIDDNDDNDGTGPDYCDENGDFEPDEVDFDSLDKDGQKAFILSRWGFMIPMAPENAESFNVAPPGRAGTRRASNMVRGEGSHGVADSIDNGVDVTRIGSHDTSQERVAVPRQRHGSDHHGSASLGRMQSNSTDEPTSISQAEHKPDESDNTSQERVAVPRQRHGSDNHGSASLSRIQSNYIDEPRSIVQAERIPDESENIPQEHVVIPTRLYGSDQFGSVRLGRMQSNYIDEPRSIVQAERNTDEFENTPQERVVAPTRIYGIDHYGSAGLDRTQSHYTDEPRSIAQAERKPDENYSSERIEHSPNTLKVTTNAGLVVGNEQMRRMLYGANARDATAPSTIVSTSTDCDERKSDENDNPKRIERYSFNTPKVITSAGRSPNTANITTSAGRSPNTPNVATSAVRSPNAPNIATSAGRSPDTPKVTTSVGLVDRTELRRRMLYNADAGDSTAPSTWTTFTTSTDSDERKSEENDDPKHIERSPNTPKVTTSAGLVDRTEVTKRVLPSANAGDATAPSTTSTTSTDRNDQGGYAEDDELEQLLGSVTKDANNSPLRLKQDGLRTRYSIRGPSSAVPNSQRTGPQEDLSLRPQPLRVRRNTKDSEDPADEMMSALDFFKRDEEDARREEAERTTAAENSYSNPAQDRDKTTRRSPYASWKKRITSTPFSKGAKGSPKQDAEDTATSPIVPRSMPRSTSSTKPSGRDESIESGSNLQPQLSSPPSAIFRATTLNASNELEFSAVPCDQGHTFTPSVEQTPTPPPKSARRKPHLPPLDTQNANDSAGGPSESSRAIAGDRTARASKLAEIAEIVSKHRGTLPSDLEDSITNFIRDNGGHQTDQPSTPMPQSPSISTGLNSSRLRRRSSSENNASSIFSPSSKKAKSERLTNESPQVKMIERRHLKENFDVLSTKELVAPEEPKPSLRKRIFSRSNTKDISTAQGHNAPETSPADVPATPIRAHNTIIGPKSSDTAPRRNLQDSLSSPTSTGRGRGYSRVSSVRTGSQPAPGSNWSTEVVSPVSSDASGSTHIRRKEVGSGPTEGAYDAAKNQSTSFSSKTSLGKVSQESSSAVNTPTTSRVQSVSEATRSHGDTSHEAIASPIPGAINDARESGMPSNRLKLEQEAAEKAGDKKLAKEDHVAYQVKKLRQATGTETVWYSPSDERPAHPSHKCTFYQKNLHCSTCNNNCAICSAPCCALKRATQAAVKDKDTAEGIAATELASSIKRWASEGRDGPTFLECTECGRWVCPGCIGLCPIFPCFDQVCATCNPGRLWKPCDFHSAEDAVVSDLVGRGMT